MNYSILESDILYNYYSKELIGKYFDEEKQFRIDIIEIKLLENTKNRYELRAKTSQNGIGLNSSTVFYEEIGKAANRFRLLCPNEILMREKVRR